MHLQYIIDAIGENTELVSADPTQDSPKDVYVKVDH